MHPSTPARRLIHAILFVAAMLLPSANLHAQDSQPAPPPQPNPVQANPQPGTPQPSGVQPRMMGEDRVNLRRARLADAPPAEPSTLPPTPPTSATPAANTLPAPIAATPNATAEQPVSHPHRAQVTLLAGQLNVRANDSSLNQILHAISRETGLKITGGVKDQRVFGDYGPASTSAILATLLDGTGTNMVLMEGDATTPPELILTPRGGGPTPPSPTDPGYVDDSIEATAPLPPTQPIQTQQQQYAPQTSGPVSIPQPLNNVNGSPLNTSPTAATLPTTNSVPTDSLPTPSTTPATQGIVDAPNPPAPGSTTGTAPNGTLSPEQQVYQQLLLQRQQQQQQSNPQPPPTTPQ